MKQRPRRYITDGLTVVNILLFLKALPHKFEGPGGDHIGGTYADHVPTFQFPDK